MKRLKSSSNPTLKKCSTPKRVLRAIGLVATLVLGQYAFDSARAAIPRKPLTPVETSLRNDLAEFRKMKKTDFESLVQKWERVYGSASAPTLLKIATDSKASTTERYVALLAHTKIRGPHDASELLALLDDRDWMVRSAALKSIEILGFTPASEKVLAKIQNDPALVIRLQAIETALRLRPTGLAETLIHTAMDGKNYRPAHYRKGRADWVPQRALAALRTLKPSGYSARLVPLMNDAKDARVRAHALHTIEVLEAKNLKSGRPFAERAAAWTSTLQASTIR